jgi:hypothetical protein
MTFLRTLRHATGPLAATLLATLLAALIAACGATGSSAESSAPSTASSVAIPAEFPVGTWSTTITADDLEAVNEEDLATIGMSRADLVKENSGTFTTTFGADGTWSTVQETDQPVRWPIFRGTFVATGDDSFDQVTTFPPDFAGDVVGFTWRVEDGMLHLQVVNPPDPVLPVLTESHPWSPAG